MLDPFGSPSSALDLLQEQAVTRVSEHDQNETQTQADDLYL